MARFPAVYALCLWTGDSRGVGYCRHADAEGEEAQLRGGFFIFVEGGRLGIFEEPGAIGFGFGDMLGGILGYIYGCN